MKTGPVDRPRRFIAPHYPPARWTDSTQRSTNKTGVNERQHDRFEKKNKTERSESETKAAKWSAGRSGRGPWIITSPFLFFFSFSLLSLSLSFISYSFISYSFLSSPPVCACLRVCVCVAKGRSCNFLWARTDRQWIIIDVNTYGLVVLWMWGETGTVVPCFYRVFLFHFFISSFHSR